MPVLKETVLLCVLAAAAVAAQGQAQVFPPNIDQKTEIHKKLAELSARLAALGSKKIDPQVLADAQIHKKAVEFVLRYPDEFVGPDSAAEAITTLDLGIMRALELDAGVPSWTQTTGNVVRGYISRVDGSVQPYRLTIPAFYDGTKPMRLEVWLQGTPQPINEVRFINQQEAPRNASQVAAADSIQLEPFGRMNRSYRFAGETDVFEAIASVQRRYNIDTARIAIRTPSSGGANPAFANANGRQAVAASGPAALRKIEGLQGPIDDAFREGFLAVRGTGQAWNPAVQDYTTHRFDTFRSEFAKWMRGDIRARDDHAVSAADIASSNLVLFGDPGSNSMLAKIIGQLPIQWTRNEIIVGSQKFSAADHALVLVYPNPLNPAKYVVLNSGHTFTADRAAFGSASMLVPRLGDYAVVTSAGEQKAAGTFDEDWKLK